MDNLLLSQGFLLLPGNNLIVILYNLLYWLKQYIITYNCLSL